MKSLRGNKSIVCAIFVECMKYMRIAKRVAPALVLLLALFVPVKQAAAQTVIGGFGISTVAGTGATSYTGDGGSALNATLNQPQRVAFDAAGNLYIADATNNVIRIVSATTGNISTIAGGGASPSTCKGSTDAVGDGCVATAAILSGPQGMVFDGQGNMYVADRGDFAVRMITNPSSGAGIITLVLGEIGIIEGATAPCATSSTAANLMHSITNPKELAFDTAGNLYISMNGNTCWGLDQIANVSGSPSSFTPGALSMIIGKDSSSESGIKNPSSGTAANAATSSIDGVCADKLGNLYLTLSSVYGIAKLTNVVVLGTNAPITLLAGILKTAGATGDGGSALAAELNAPESSIVDPSGNIFIADQSNNKIREVLASSGEIVTVAGTGVSGYSADGVAALTSELKGPRGLAFDAVGNLYIADGGNNRVRKLSMSNPLTFPPTAVGSSASATLYLETVQATTLNSLAMTSSLGDFTIGAASGCTVNGTTSNPLETVCAVPVTFTPQYANQRSVPVSLIDGSNNVDSFELTGTGTAPVVGLIPPTISTLPSMTGLLKAPSGGAAVDTGDNLYIADTGNNVVRKITPAGVATVLAGTGTSGFSGDGSAATSASLNAPRGVAADGYGNIYIADTGNQVIRMVSSTGIISTVAGTAGTGGYSGDNGSATAATLSAPSGLAADAYGAVYIADTGNNVIRKLFNGNIATMAGVGGAAGFAGDGGLAGLAKLSSPSGVAVDSQRNVYIADQGNDVVRKVSAYTGPATTGLISTVAGSGGLGGYGGDGPLECPLCYCARRCGRSLYCGHRQ
jgi:sugar lactone lactonase YvrE